MESVVWFIDFGCQSVVSADSICYFFVPFCTFLVQNDEDQIESWEEWVRHADVFGGRDLGLILAVDRVGSCNNRTSGIEGAVHSCLGDCDCLLLHHLVDCYSVDFVHLVELVDADHSSVCQHHGSCFQGLLAWIFVWDDCCCQTYTTCAASCCSDCQLGCGEDPSEDLTFCCTRIAHHKHIYISS